MTDTS